MWGKPRLQPPAKQLCHGVHILPLHSLFLNLLKENYKRLFKTLIHIFLG